MCASKARNSLSDALAEGTPDEMQPDSAPEEAQPAARPEVIMPPAPMPEEVQPDARAEVVQPAPMPEDEPPALSPVLQDMPAASRGAMSHYTSTLAQCVTYHPAVF